ncbi:MAG: polysaccharide lyase family 7 protein [Pseudomonas sp.]|uniref:polysaccharide lyase family 7 protein n=1 Tax=Pseudomonas abieticivorans TaxID=2931382 RepID=UPI0020BF54DD|nr:polysaccharide lyase family 7 protein [Pseudomonas sp. PIA16]MDE1167081.1 polysaccharide lyase family 7 protein [Pseudomonas sp.]
MIDLSTWNLSIPVGTPAKTVDTPTLVSGFKDQYFHSDTGTLFFWAPVTGTVTESAKYPRTELRETNADGSEHNWTYPGYQHFLRATLEVNQVPSSGKIVIGQIHVNDSNKPLLKVEYQYKESKGSGNIVAKVRYHPDDENPTVIIVAEDVPLDKQFSYSIHLSSMGELSVSAADYHWQTKISATWRVAELYFKAGVYTQDNTGYTSEGGKVTFYKLKINHDKS